MKVICTSTCQQGHKKRFLAGQEYEVEKDFYNRNKDFFKKVKTQKKVGETDEKQG